jgi:hypothetical protein
VSARAEVRLACEAVVIIGAARSGTNMLRDLLTKVDGVATWDCDEINYIWRYGNSAHPSDELTPAQATERVRAYIRRAFARLARATGARMVVEKTCANSLRVDFVDRVLPEARYVFIVRDGRDVVASAMKRWQTPFNIREVKYGFKKVWYVPGRDLPYYIARYVRNFGYRLLGRQGRLAFWGPRAEGLETILGTGSLAQACAAQWVRSVERAERALGALPAGHVHRVSYEALVLRPADEVARLLDFLGLAVSEAARRELVRPVSAQTVGKWKHDLSVQEQAAIEPMLRPLLDRHGYL